MAPAEADAALIRAYELGDGENGWTDADDAEAAQLVPVLVAAGYADEKEWGEGWALWHFTEAGVKRYEELRPLEAE